MKLLRTVCFSLLAIALSACSNTFVYNQLDWLVPWYVDDYVDMTREQRNTLKSRVNDLLRWHRAEELASYIEILDQIESDLAGPVTGEQVEHWANLTLAAYERLEEKMLPVAFELGHSMSDEQMAEFIEQLRENQQELEEKYLERSDEEYVAESREDFTDNLDDFLGRLGPEQLAVIDDAAISLQRFDSAWLEERALWIDTLAELLQRDPGWEQAIRGALAARDENRSEAYRSAYAHNAVIINNAIAEVISLRSEKQDRRLRREIDDFRRDINKLIAQGKD